MRRNSTCWRKGNALQLEHAKPEGSWRLPGRIAKKHLESEFRLRRTEWAPALRTADVGLTKLQE